MARVATISRGEFVEETTCLRLSLKNSHGTTQLVPALVEHLLQTILDDKTSRPIILEGIPGSFCEGLDLGSLAHQSVDDFDIGLERFSQLLVAIEQTPRPVIALVDGSAMGGGLGLAAVSDVVLASSRGNFSLPETLMGIIPAVVFPYIARRIGVSKARLMALGAKSLSANDALQAGLVDDVDDDVEVVCRRYTKRFMRMDPQAIGVMKSLVANHFTAPANYKDDATNNFHKLLVSKETRARLKRFAAGDSPWIEEA